MNKLFKIGIAGVLVFGAIAAVITGIALAQTDQPPTTDQPPATGNTATPQWGRGFGRELGGQVGLDAAAQALGMTSEELSAQLWAGKSLADIAEEKGVDLVELQSTVQAAVQTERETAMRDAINQAVANGTITQENADWLLEGLDKGFLTKGFGLGMERSFGGGDFHGHGPGQFVQPDSGQPNTTPQSDASGGA
jgi:hypothetical protein